MLNEFLKNSIGPGKNFQKLNDLYIETLELSRKLLATKSLDDAPCKVQTYEIKTFFNSLDPAVIILIDRIRQAKVEFFSTIPALRELLDKNKKLKDKISDLIYEYVFSGFAITFLDYILKYREEIAWGGKSIRADLLYEKFSKRAAAFRIPEMHDFFTNSDTSDVADLFKFLFDYMYEQFLSLAPQLKKISHNIEMLVRELIEKSPLEGMILFETYKDWITQKFEARDNSLELDLDQIVKGVKKDEA
ncbi:MAG: hypothetical protein QMC67_10975 [Candidatus Wallbacteria bacterium]